MTARVLDPSEWPTLAGTEAEAAWPYFDPQNAQVLVVEDEGRIVGTWTVMRVVHAECCWVHPDYRGSFGVTKRLLRGMRALATGWGARAVVTGAMTAQVKALVASLHGVPLPGEQFVIPLETLCQQPSR